eukprot:EG_transcript_28048
MFADSAHRTTPDKRGTLEPMTRESLCQGAGGCQKKRQKGRQRSRGAIQPKRSDVADSSLRKVAALATHLQSDNWKSEKQLPAEGKKCTSVDSGGRGGQEVE